MRLAKQLVVLCIVGALGFGCDPTLSGSERPDAAEDSGSMPGPDDEPSDAGRDAATMDAAIEQDANSPAHDTGVMPLDAAPPLDATAALDAAAALDAGPALDDASALIDSGPDDGGSSPVDANEPDAAGCELVSCGEHEHCQTAGPNVACVCDDGYDGPNCCPAGYEADGDGCAWVGVIDDGGFDGDGWVARGGVVTQLGSARFDNIAACFGGSISQKIRLPAYSDTAPLVLRYGTQRESQLTGAPRPGVSIDGVMYRAKHDFYDTDWHENSVCLGERVYGREFELSFMSFQTYRACTMDPFRIDSVRIEHAAPGECPTADAPIPNAELTQSDVGWIPAVGQEVGEIVVGNGEIVMSGNECMLIGVTGHVWLPMAKPEHGLAIQLTTTVGPEIPLYVELNDRTIGAIDPAGIEETHRICVPTWARGAVVDLGLGTTSHLLEYYRGCNSSRVVDIVVTDIALVEDDACASDDAILQPGFEALDSALLASPWMPHVETNTSPPLAKAEVIDDAPSAFHGGAALRLQAFTPCQFAVGATSVSVPLPTDDSAGPAVTYAYRYPVTGDPGSDLLVCTDSSCDSLPTSDTWVEHTQCLDPVLAGRQLPLQLELVGGGGNCSQLVTGEVIAWFDEVQLGLSPDCAAH